MKDGSNRAARALRVAYRKRSRPGHGRRYGDLQLVGRAALQARPYWPHLGGVLALSLLSVPLALLGPVGLKIAVDSVIGSHPLPGFLDAVVPAAVANSDDAVLLLAGALIVAVAVLGRLLGIARGMLGAYTGERLVLDFRTRLFERLQRLSLSYHDRTGSADAIYRVQYDASAIQPLLMSGLAPLVTAMVMVVALLYVTFRIDWQLGLIALSLGPVLGVVAHSHRRRLRSRSREVKELETGALSVVQEALSAMRVVKAFGQEDREQDRFAHSSGEGMHARLRLTLLSERLSALVGVMTALGTATVLVVGVRHVQASVITLGDLLLVMAYLSQLYSPLKTVSERPARIQKTLASLERVVSVLDETPEVAERPRARPLSRAGGQVVFRNVCFSYDRRHPAVRDVSFEVEPGTRVGISGQTGAGKSTLASLMVRFYDPASGAILLDGVDLRDYRLADLRKQFAIVLQEPILFATSIAENIAYGRPDAGLREIERAAAAANVHDFIASLPDGYRTAVGERGVRLSGGERQRISLARALLKDAPILVLDEPTSSVDMGTEAVILEAIDRMARGRTTFLIAHRPSALENCDLHLEMDGGRLVAIGPLAARLTPA
jgi:ATP-binding cassette subfamily B protein